mmetsp:Transcript_30990/g.66986  ORF Transcript_30990/g.66986 Transcript_30990/m.66986 type:complete len:212 (+) Transcript_30990:2352-2987(+)
MWSFQIWKDKHVLVECKHAYPHVRDQRSILVFLFRCRNGQSPAHLSNSIQCFEPSVTLDGSMMMMMIRHRNTSTVWRDVLHPVQVDILHRSLLPHAVRSANFVFHRATPRGGIKGTIAYRLLRQDNGAGGTAHVAIVRLHRRIRAAQKIRYSDGRGVRIEVRIASIAPRWRHGARPELDVRIAFVILESLRSTEHGNSLRVGHRVAVIGGE